VPGRLNVEGPLPIYIVDVQSPVHARSRDFGSNTSDFEESGEAHGRASIAYHRSLPYGGHEGTQDGEIASKVVMSATRARSEGAHFGRALTVARRRWAEDQTSERLLIQISTRWPTPEEPESS
jgi:hypothetical protein